MTLGRVQLDWGELEFAPGEFDRDTLREALAREGSGGRHVFVTLSTLDSEGLTLPADLMTDAGTKRRGTRLDDRAILNRLTAFLEWMVPELKRAGVFALSVANEFDSPMNDGIVDRGETMTFLKHAMDTANRLDPDLAVTVTYTGHAVRDNAAAVVELKAHADLLTFNTYCLTPMVTVNGLADWQATLTAWKAAAGDLPIMIQELGCPAGYGRDRSGPYAGRHSGIGASADTQEAYLAWHVERIMEDRQLLGATWFQLLDWSPALSRSFTAVFAEEGLDWLGQRVEEWLATTGLCRWSDLSCGSAWDTWLRAMARLADAREAR